MSTIIFSCESITPILMHGADGASAELRPASIKGILRFWWRAIHGNLPLKELKEKEGEIFGSTERRSKVNLRIANIKEITKKFKDLDQKTKEYHGIRYNFYPTLMKKSEEKEYFDSLSFDLIISSNETIALEETINALIYLNFFGAIGSRSRRGAGSIKIMLKENKDKLFENKLELLNTNSINTKEQLKAHIDTLLDTIIPHSSLAYTTFYKNIYIFDSKKDWQSALETIANPFKKFRNDKQSDVWETPNFGFPIMHEKGTFIGGNINNKVERRASPLMFKVFKVSNEHYFTILSWLYGDLLPSKEHKIIKKYNPRTNKQPSENIINEFIKQFDKKDYIKVTKNG